MEMGREGEGSVGAGLKRPGWGHKGGKSAAGEGRRRGERSSEQPHLGNPAPFAGTFLNAPNFQSGK